MQGNTKNTNQPIGRKHPLLWGMLLVTLGATAGCNGTNKSRSTDARPAATISYNLPETKARVALTLTLAACDRTPTARASVSVTPIATQNRDDALRFTLEGPELQSFLKKRDVAIDLYPHGAIKTINAGVTDSSPAIIGSILKLAAGVLGVSTGTLSGACNQATLAALAARQALKTKIEALRGSLDTSSDPDATAKYIAALINEFARLETGPLQLKLMHTITFENGVDGGLIRWTTGDFEKWMGAPTKAGSVDIFSLAFCVKPANAQGNNNCGTALAAVEAAKDPQAIGDIECVNGNVRCPKTIVFREPVPSRLVLSANTTGDFIKGGKSVQKDDKLASKDLLVAQKGKLSYLPLSVGFGGSKTVSLTLDEFGRKTKFGWVSSASGAGVVSGLTALSETKATLDGEELKSMSDTITELETRQKLNKLENCRAILESGGFVCPTE